jgi:hypothetical protein
LRITENATFSLSMNLSAPFFVRPLCANFLLWPPQTPYYSLRQYV